MPTPPKATRHNNLTKLLVLLSLRANSKRTFQCKIPCTRHERKLRIPFLRAKHVRYFIKVKFEGKKSDPFFH